MAIYTQTTHRQLWNEETGTVFVCVEETLFRLEACQLTSQSAYFQNILGYSTGNAGSSTETAIRVENSSAHVFSMFASVAFSMRPHISGTVDEAIELLEMSAFLASPDVREHALDLIEEEAWRIPAPKLINICFHSGTRRFFVDAFKCLAGQPVYNLSDEDVVLIEPIYVSLTRLCKKVEMYWRIACCKPKPLDHNPSCSNNELCDSEWLQLWWNTMGRHVLNGQDPFDFRPAIKKIKASEFGQMNIECRKALENMSTFIAFFQVKNLITESAEELACDITEIDGYE